MDLGISKSSWLSLPVPSTVHVHFEVVQPEISGRCAALVVSGECWSHYFSRRGVVATISTVTGESWQTVGALGIVVGFVLISIGALRGFDIPVLPDNALVIAISDLRKVNPKASDDAKILADRIERELSKRAAAGAPIRVKRVSAIVRQLSGLRPLQP